MSASASAMARTGTSGTAQVPADLLGNHPRHPNIRLPRHAGDMRREDEARTARKEGSPGSRERLLLEDVERRPAEFLVPQSRADRGLVDDAAARRVDQDRARFHARERGAVDE